MRSLQARNWIAAMILLSAVIAIPAARAAGQTDVKKILQANYNDRDTAVSRKDVEGTLAHYAPEFVGVNAAGKTHDLKEEHAEFVKTFTSVNAKSNLTRSTIQKLTLGKAGTEATVTVRRLGTLILVSPQTHLNEVLALDGVYLDTWAKRPTGWLLTREQVSTFKATINGKPL